MKRAFTIIELLFVLTIVSVLAGFALQSVSSLNSFSLKGKFETAMLSSKNLADKMLATIPSEDFREGFDSEGWKNFDKNGNYYIRVYGRTYRFSNDLKGSSIRLSSGCCAYVSGKCITGYYISMKNYGLHKRMSYNSCTQNQPSYTSNYGGAE